MNSGHNIEITGQHSNSIITAGYSETFTKCLCIWLAVSLHSKMAFGEAKEAIPYVCNKTVEF